MGIRLSRGDVVLFLDDDAVADARWIERYESLFGRVDRCGGISGVVVPARVVDGKPAPSARRDAWRPGREIFYRRPIAGLEDYCAAFSVAGQLLSRCDPEGRIVQSLGFVGANMGFRREAVLGSRLAELYSGSRRCAHNESFLALRAVISGYRACLCRDPAHCPAVLHISGHPSLTRMSGPYQELWSQYDCAKNFHRLRKMGVRTSTPASRLSRMDDRLAQEEPSGQATGLHIRSVRARSASCGARSTAITSAASRSPSGPPLYPPSGPPWTSSPAPLDVSSFDTSDL
jgi:cellulose synthase/poly-beta-1,6-N-acetylglucosamine synthase-like glycosyltransferase